MDIIVKQLSAEFKLKNSQVENTIKLIDEGNTIPFIARYRKEQTGNMSDVILRDLNDRLTYLRNLSKRKEDVIKSISDQEKLTDELKAKIEAALTLTDVEDIYRPFKPKRRTRATIAIDKGLKPLAEIIFAQEITEGDIEEIAKDYVNPELKVENTKQAIKGALDIIAEMISDTAEYRKIIREMIYRKGQIITKATDADAESVYEMYYKYSEPVDKIPPHRVLAINRGEKEKQLKVKIDCPDELVVNKLKSLVITNENTIFADLIVSAIADSYKRLVFPSIERELRSLLTERSEEQAIRVFGLNLKNLLLVSPVKGNAVMGFDPAYRTGCKIAIVDETGKLLDYTTVYPTAPQNKVKEAKKELLDLIDKHNVKIIAIGNGTASRESELIVAEMIKESGKDVYYTIVNEAGASVYSASKLANDEHPDINVSIRGAISIARRLQDPMAELVKIEPKHVGVGQYQHDVNQKRLNEVLGGVVEDVVNTVGVDLNTASPALLSYISGVTKPIAKNIVAYRDELGQFTNRNQLKKVKRLGGKAFEQCAGFLRIANGDNPLDNTSVHPESYDTTKNLLSTLDYTVTDDFNDIENRIKKTCKMEFDTNKRYNSFEALKALKNTMSDSDKLKKGIKQLAGELEIGEPTLKDIITELTKPGRDIRDEMPKPQFRSDVLKMEDLKVDMILPGTVRNVVDFGAFVDIGVKQDGLVHISEMSHNYVKNPMDVLSVGDEVDVKIIGLDIDRSKISLSIKQAKDSKK